ncbi:hypothetical protein, partial [Chondromyces apiculatus]|uniref:hypothetical protein n=1 Tax=Chondromyces apiculatus TaxID=51 RepID=UPI0005C72C33
MTQDMTKVLLTAALLLLASSASIAHAAEGLRPIEEAITLGAHRCLEGGKLAEHVGMWLKTRDLDTRLAIEVAETPEGVRFVVRREGTVLGERTLAVRDVACPEIHAAVALGIASAIDATLLVDLGLAPPRPPEPAPPAPSPTAAPDPATTPPGAAAPGMFPP